MSEKPGPMKRFHLEKETEHGWQEDSEGAVCALG